MAYTMEQANALLANISTEAELRNLISQLDVSASGNTTLLYSGTMSDGTSASFLAQTIGKSGKRGRI